jgi:hypothetical protein
MRTAVLLVVIPYAISVLTKLSSVILDRAALRKAFFDVMKLNVPGSGPPLDSAAQSIILGHLSYPLLRHSVVISSLLYGFAAVVVIYERRDYSSGLAWLLFFLLLGIAFLWWVFPRDVAYFSKEVWLKLSKGEWAQILLCVYDVSLATLSVRLILTAPHLL